MICRPDDRNVVCDQPGMPSIDFSMIGHLHREMVKYLVGRVRDIGPGREARRIEKGDRRSVDHPKEYVEIRERIAGRRNRVVYDGTRQLHTHDTRVEIGSRLDVVRHPGGMAEHERRQTGIWRRNGPSPRRSHCSSPLKPNVRFICAFRHSLSLHAGTF